MQIEDGKDRQPLHQVAMAVSIREITDEHAFIKYITVLLCQVCYSGERLL